MKRRKQINQINHVLSETLELYRLWARKHHISYTTLVVLYTLDYEQCCTQKQICDWWALPKQTVHSTLLELQHQGYISSHSNKLNKRERLLSFTEEGTAFAQSMLSPLYQMEENAMEQLGDELRVQLMESNTKFYELLKQEMNQYEHDDL